MAQFATNALIQNGRYPLTQRQIVTWSTERPRSAMIPSSPFGRVATLDYTTALHTIFPMT